MPDTGRQSRSVDADRTRRTAVRLLTRRLTLRTATPLEIAALASRLSDTRGSFDAAQAIRDVLACGPGQRHVCLSLEDRTSRRVVGLGALLVPNAADGVPWIGLLVVEDGRRNVGLGTEAVAALERFFARRGWSEVRLNVHRANGGALRFWSRLGYGEIRDAWRRYDLLDPQVLTLSKTLAPGAPRSPGRPMALARGSGVRQAGGVLPRVPSSPVVRPRRGQEVHDERR